MANLVRSLIKNARLKREIMKDRKATKIKAKTMPDLEMMERLVSVFKEKNSIKLDRESLKTDSPSWKKYDDFFEHLQKTIAINRLPLFLERNKTISRIATKYALDAIGLSARFDAEKRRKIINLVNQITDNIERKGLILRVGDNGHAISELISREIHAFDGEFRDVLGFFKSRLFYDEFIKRWGFMTSQLERLPVYVK